MEDLIDMESPDRTRAVSLDMEPRTPVRGADTRPRSATMIPYVDVKDRTDSRVLSPIPRLHSPFPDLSPAKEPLIELEKELSNLTILTIPSPPTRTTSPFPSHPFVTDPVSLQVAVTENPTRIFEAIQKLVNDRDAATAESERLAAELQSVNDDLNNTRADHKASRHRWEELFRISSAKQLILWKYVESLQSQLAAAKGLPDPSLGAGGMGTNLRGGLGMGVAMEKWISEGIDADRVCRTEEGSEQGTENSFWSADDSVGTRNLDPSAQAFVPQIGSPKKFRQRSPGKRFKDRSPTKNTHGHKPIYTQYAVYDPYRDQQQAYGQMQAMNTTVNPLIPVPPPNSLIAHLPPRWYGICPYSLADSPSACPLKMRCEFVPLCPNYNDLSGDGCSAYTNKGPSGCRYAHEYRFCEDLVAGKPGGCDYEEGFGNHPASKESTIMARELHMRVRVHMSTCDRDEWAARILLLSMREAHGNGLFNGHKSVGPYTYTN